MQNAVHYARPWPLTKATFLAGNLEKWLFLKAKDVAVEALMDPLIACGSLPTHVEI
jgi:hypothetical protein